MACRGKWAGLSARRIPGSGLGERDKLKGEIYWRAVMELAPMHWVVVAVVALLLFGPKKLPELGKGIGEGIKNFKDGLKQGTETTTAKTETPAASQTPQA